MLEQELVQQGADLLLFGMGTVFIFLSLLVLSTTLMSAFINRFFPEADIPQVVSDKAPGGKPKDVEPNVLTAIQMAIKEHRAKQSR